MSAVMVAVADALLTDLNADPEGNFDTYFVAERSYAEWDDTLEDEDELHVDVVAGKHPKSELADRGGSILHEVTVQIVVRQRLRRRPETKRFQLDGVDRLVLLNQTIFDYFVLHELSTLTTATWRDSKLVTDYVRKHLRENSQYTGISEVSFEVIG